VKAVVVESFTYPDVPLEQLARELSVVRGEVGSLMYQALFSFQDGRQRITRWGELKHDIIPLFQQGATEDLGMWFVETNNGMHGGITYNTDILTSETAQNLRKRYTSLLIAAAVAPNRTVADLAGPVEAATRARATQKQSKPARQVTVQSVVSKPTTETEKLLAEIWCKQLKLTEVSTTDNFFDLGGHSLLAMQAILTMEERTGKRVDRGRFIFESLGQIARSYDEATVEPVHKPGGLRGLFSSLMGAKKG
jgi:acyl carrier protein